MVGDILHFSSTVSLHTEHYNAVCNSIGRGKKMSFVQDGLTSHVRTAKDLQWPVWRGATGGSRGEG